MDFVKHVKMKQYEMNMSNVEFAKYLGLGRSWLVNLYRNDETTHPLRYKTMGILYSKLNISIEEMEEFNKNICRSRICK